MSNRITMVAANLNRGGVTDHMNLLAQALRGHGLETTVADRHFFDEPKRLAEWIGLHFVCYAWARHGILSGADIKNITRICQGRSTVVFFHELWIGESKAEPLKNRIIGAIQRHRIKSLLREIRPARIFTHTPAYQQILSFEGIEASVIRLAGNLPASTATDIDYARSFLAGHNVGSGDPVAVVFGTIHPEWNPLPALQDWARGRRPVLLTIGRHGLAGEALLKKYQSEIPELRIISIGEQPAERIAGFLQVADFGFSTSPWALIGKSGTAAAFLEAGLPVVVTRNDWQWRRGETPPPEPHPRLHLWHANRPIQWDQLKAQKEPFSSQLPEVARAWLKAIRG